MTLRTPGEKNPRVSIPVHAASRGTVEVVPPADKLSDAHGTLLAALVAQVSGEQIESPPIWIIQEGRLTYETGDSSSSPKGRIEETGEGLPEYLDEIGNRQGVAAIAEALAHLNIRFHDGSGGLWAKRKFRVRPTDPFESDRIPDWLIHAKTEPADLREAIQTFVARHDRHKLRKHASRGNINGMNNFLDIFTTLVRIQYIWWKRSDEAAKRVYVKKFFLIKWLCDWIDLATSGRESEEDSFDGYLYSLWDSLSGDYLTLGKVCEDHHYCRRDPSHLVDRPEAQVRTGREPGERQAATQPAGCSERPSSDDHRLFRVVWVGRAVTRGGVRGLGAIQDVQYG